MTKKDRFFSALKKGDLKSVKKLLEKMPELLDAYFDWPGFSGSPLHVAAFNNHPDIITFLITEKKLPVDCTNRANSTPLLHASANGSFDAASLLLQMGANPLPPPNYNHDTPAKEASTPRMQELFRPYVEEEHLKEVEKLRQQRKQENQEKAADSPGAWTCPSPVEVVHDRQLNGAGCRLTDVFNFETRRWISITRDAGTGHLAQNDRFFDEVADKEILKIAYARLIELGGKADPDVINSRLMNKPKPSGKGG